MTMLHSQFRDEILSVVSMNLPGVRKYAPKTNILDNLRPGYSLAVLFVLALVLRIVFLGYRFAVAFDEVNYLKLGVSGHLNGLGDVLHTYWSPLLPALIALLSGIIPDYELAARLVGVLAGAASIFPVYHLGKEVFDSHAGLLAAAFIAIFPPLAFQSTLILTEPLVMLLGACAVLFGLRMMQRYSIGYALIASAFAALAYLAHPLGTGFFVLILLWLVAGSFLKSFLITRLRLVYLIPSALLGFLLLASLYLSYLHGETGTWTLSAKGAANQQMETPLNGKESAFRALDETNSRVPIDMIFHQGTFLKQMDGGKRQIREVELMPFIVKFVKNFANLLQRAIPETMTTLPLLLFGVGLFGAAWPVQKSKYIAFLLSFLLFFWFLVIPAFHIHLRYLTPMWPICAVFIGRGFQHLHGWLSEYMPITKLSWKKKINASAVAGSLVLAVFIIFSLLPESLRVLARNPVSREYVADPVDQKAAGTWLRQNFSGTPVVMSRNHSVDVYAGNYEIEDSVTIPTDSLERVLSYARNRNVTHLVLNERYLSDYPKLAGLLKGEAPESDLRLIYKEADASGLMTVIYEVH